MNKLAVALVFAVATNIVVAKGGGHSGSGSGASHGSHSSGGAHHVGGYTKKSGTYVAPHRATNPNKTKRDNWSSKGNVNPDTGKKGMVDPNKR